MTLLNESYKFIFIFTSNRMKSSLQTKRSPFIDRMSGAQLIFIKSESVFYLNYIQLKQLQIRTIKISSVSNLLFISTRIE